MSKAKNLNHKLDKETRNRHFPESNGGKGSHARKSTVDQKIGNVFVPRSTRL